MVALLSMVCSFKCLANESQNAFAYTDSLPQAAAGLAGVRSENGNIYAIGGYGYFLNMIPVASNLIRVYDIETNTWQVSRAKLRTPRMYCSAGICKEQTIFIAGGISQNNTPLASIEIYYPELENSPQETVTCKYIGDMSTPRRNPIVNVLDDGRILISGNSKQPDIVEKDSEGKFLIRAAKGKMHFERSEHSTVKLNDGRICFIAGRRKSIEIFDPKTETFNLMKSKFQRFYDDQAVALLYNGKILIVGGQDIMANNCTDHTWLYDPISDTLNSGPNLIASSGETICHGISDMKIIDLDINNPGKVLLLCGGEDDNGKEHDITLNSAWIYYAENNQFVKVSPMLQPHDDFLLFSLPPKNGKLRALIVAGHTTNDKVSDKCEIFQFDSLQTAHINNSPLK